jgi:hypothetical protein
MPPKAAHENSRVKLEMSTNHTKAATQRYFSRGAAFSFLSFFRKLRKRKENPAYPINPVR